MTVRNAFLPITVLAVVACSSDAVPDIIAPEPQEPNLVSVQGAPGEEYEYDQQSSVITVFAEDGNLQIDVEGDEYWAGTFAMPSGNARFETGTYDGVSWSGDQRACLPEQGSFTVERVRYEPGGRLASIELTFEQVCVGQEVPLRGRIRWRSGDLTQPPGPAVPSPTGLWAPPSTVPPLNDVYVYLESETGDVVGGGTDRLYERDDVEVDVFDHGRHVTVMIHSPTESWRGDFLAMWPRQRLDRGYYADLKLYPTHNPAKGGVGWSRNGIACDDGAGWFVVDEVTYSNGVLIALTLRFEQSCADDTAVLRGAIRWSHPW